METRMAVGHLKFQVDIFILEIDDMVVDFTGSPEEYAAYLEAGTGNFFRVFKEGQDDQK